MTMLIPGVITAIAFFILILKMNHNTQRLIYGYDIPVDIAATVIMMMLFSGTFSGMLAAMIGGLLFSIMLMVAKKFRGYRKLIVTVRPQPNSRIPNVNVQWLDLPGAWARRPTPTRRTT